LAFSTVSLELKYFASSLTVHLTEGLNGRLPNQDLITSAGRIAQWTGQTPIIIYDHVETAEPIKKPSFLPPVFDKIFSHPLMKTYAYRAKNVVRHAQYEGLNRASGVHGLFHK